MDIVQNVEKCVNRHRVLKGGEIVIHVSVEKIGWWRSIISTSPL